MKRAYKIAAAVVAGVLIVGLTVTTIVFHNQNQSLKKQVGAFYSKAFEELMNNMDSLQTKLCKLEAASGVNQQSILLMDVWRQTGDTQNSISTLPVSYEGVSTLTQFINRAGDYCRSLSRKLSQGDSLSQEDAEQISALAASCGAVYDKLVELWQQGYPISGNIEQDVFLAVDTGEGNLDFANQEFPRLQYDGPFSESTENKEPEGLGSGEVTREQAAQAAADFLGIEASALTDAGELAGNIGCYSFEGEINGRPFSINITKTGGKVLTFMCNSDGGISAVPTDEKYEQLSKAAQEFLVDKGYGESAPSYAQFYNGMAVINLAPVEDEVVLYPDLIKVWVDIPTGEVRGMDAYNYLMSHKQRTLPAPVLTQEEAREKVNIEVTDVRLALIPLETNEEKLCWEFTGSLNEQDYIVYINAKTGMEEDILMIRHINDGILVM